MRDDLWPDDRVKQLTMLWARGLSASQIAVQMGGVSRSAVIGKVHRLGLPKRSTVKSHRLGVKVPAGTGRGALSVKQLERKAHVGVIERAPPKSSRKNPVRFVDRAPHQCPMFLEGEEGAHGFVCGNAREPHISWCRSCASRVFNPQKIGEAA